MALTIDNVLSQAASAAPHRVAATLGDGALTFGQLQSAAARCANALHGMGIQRGDRVVVWCDLSLDIIGLKFALGRLGAVFAPLNPGYAATETRAMLEYLRPRLLIVDPAHAEIAEVLAGELELPLATLVGNGPGLPLDRLIADASNDSAHLPRPHEVDPLTIFATSGSTGRPKGVMVSHRATWLRSFAGAGADIATKPAAS